MKLKLVGSVVQCFKRRDCDRQSLGSKPTPAILLCPWERHFTALPLLGGLACSFKFQSYLLKF